MRIAKHIASPNTTTLGILVATAIDNVVYDTIEKWLDAGGVDAQTSEALAEVLQRSEIADSITSGLKNAFQSEYVFMRNTLTMNSNPRSARDAVCDEVLIDECDTALPWYLLANKPYHLRPNETVALFAQYWRAHVDALATYCDAPAPIVYKSPNIEKPAPLLMFTENALGHVIFSVLSTGSYEDSIERTCDLTERNTVLTAKLRKNATNR